MATVASICTTQAALLRELMDMTCLYGFDQYV